MQKSINIILAILVWTSSFCQKPPVDSTVFGNWPSLSGARLSNDGKYIMYAISHQPAGSQTLVFSSADRVWELRLPGIQEYQAYFTNDSHKAIVLLGGDSLAIFILGRKEVEYIPHVKSIKMPDGGRTDCFAYLSDLPGDTCVVRSCRTRKLYSQPNVVNYAFNGKGNSLLLWVQPNKHDDGLKRMEWMNLPDGRVTTIWTGKETSDFFVDATGRRIAFLATDSLSGEGKYSIWQYTVGSDKAQLMVDYSASAVGGGYYVANKAMSFSRDGNTVFFICRKPIAYVPENKGVNIWTYKDKDLQTHQMADYMHDDSTAQCAVNLPSHAVITLSRADERVLSLDGKSNYRYVLVLKHTNIDAYYNKASRTSLFLESIRDGSRKLIREQFNYFAFRVKEPVLSPNERYVIWFDIDSLAWFSYEIETSITRNLSTSIPSAMLDKEALAIGRINCFGLAGWGKDDRRLWLYDQYDIWEIDPRGVRHPVNLTCGEGQRQKVVFGLIHSIRNDPASAILLGKDILLSGFNRDTKENGFWLFDPDQAIGPRKCIMSPDAWWIERTGNVAVEDYGSAGLPVKALASNVYLVKRMNCAESPNLFVTKDFKSFVSVSDIHPENNFNWMRSELVNWKTTNGGMSQGILYKPQNFDPTRKYPVIFYYYEQESSGLNKFIEPDYTNDNINIAFYVSNGYLVFVPDIHYTMRQLRWSVLNTVVSAAGYLSHFPWVDSTRMGLQGHSYGGMETNLLVTHSHLFAAACEAAGVSDVVSAFGQTRYGNGTTSQEMFEIYQGPFGLGTTPWTDQRDYIDNSAVFSIDSVTTPLLMVHGRKDGSVPFDQAIEFFTGLRRAGKKVWLLDYDDGDHSFSDNESKDYTARLQQFFGYYLKGDPPPVWMTKGIPFLQKGKESGLQPDLSGDKP
jgi:hypothetical protein